MVSGMTHIERRVKGQNSAEMRVWDELPVGGRSDVVSRKGGPVKSRAVAELGATSRAGSARSALSAAKAHRLPRRGRNARWVCGMEQEGSGERERGKQARWS